ncbi:hypothetical protein ACKGJO_06015 [Gracilimonas sp. Q87]|uniref:hypothetical protein n=1 Tax=Gracilimonas sp. Q87 TaxID=3384766 RepID=UPI003983DBB6
MILKNVFGKTIEAAKKSAQQMYGNDLLVLESNKEDGLDKASITIFSDEKNKNKEQFPAKSQAESEAKKAATNVSEKDPGVKFEQSASTERKHTSVDFKKDKLSSLRQYARQLDNSKLNDTDDTLSNDAFTFNGEQKQNIQGKNSTKRHDTEISAYGRAAVRKVFKENSKSKSPSLEKEEHVNRDRSNKKLAHTKGFITHFKQTESSREKQKRPLVISPNRNEQREINALHKRFDKLEALLDSALMSANLDYASHPAFQQLVHTGINTTVIGGWFSKIIEKGIDPYDQPEQFMVKLAAIIRNALGEAKLDGPQKYMLFIGPSGSGKTSLIMKLSQHPELMEKKKVAILSIHPKQNNTTPYYTILKPFCVDHDLPYFEISKGKDVNDHLDIWSEFDHVLIDTPSINIERENSFRDFWKIRQMLTPLTPLEIHYVVNASLNKFYFRNSSANHHPLQPDHIAITHLDEVSEWGPIIPFLQEMGCTARYISRGGEESPNSLGEFDPRWFAQRILQDN